MTAAKHLEVKLLNGGYHASRSNLRNTQEWPPTPARLFSALVNGYYDLTRVEGPRPEARTALEWLENHLPEVRFPSPVEPVGEARYATYVPINKLEGFKKDHHGHSRRSFLWPDRQERAFPAVYPESPYIYYSWPGLEGPWGEIERIASELYYFGTSRSQASFRLLDELPEHAQDYNHYVPAKPGDRRADLRMFVYYPGRLAELDACFDRKVRAPNSAAAYTKVTPPKEMPHQGMFSEVLVYRIVGKKVFDVTNAALVADAFRSEMLSLCTLLGNEPPSVVAHDHDRPHLAYLPLPFVNRYYRDAATADNLIHGVGVGIPHGLDSDEVQSIKRLLSALGRFRYAGREFGVIPVGGENQPKTLRLETWGGPATTWATVTPVEVRWRTDNNQYIREHCQQLGLPDIESIETHSHSLFGPDMAKAFVSRNYEKGRQAGFLTHAVIRFSKPVNGPLALGRTRNFGLGLLRPIYD